MADNNCGITDLSCQLAWLQDEVKGFFVWMAEQVFDGCVAVINAIPVPSWMSGVGSLVAGISSHVWYFASIAQLGFGVGVIASAYTIRFLIRRIPVIG